MTGTLTSVEVCAGAGGQALGLEQAGFEHLALVDNDAHCCKTLRANRPSWNVIHSDLESFDGKPFEGVDLLSGGLPCPPFSVAGKQLGKNDERNLFPAFFRLIREVTPRAILVENVRGFLDPVFEDYRQTLRQQFTALGYECDWKLLQASDFGVSQLRPRVAIVAMPLGQLRHFAFPDQIISPEPIGSLLHDLMSKHGWKGATAWANAADKIAPTIVGGSKKHGGPDLGPTRARRAWAELGVEGRTIADREPESDFEGMPRLTVRMVARVQGFPDDWVFTGKKTPAYRQVGNAFPPPVAYGLGKALAHAIRQSQGKRHSPRLKASA
ncbi:DNA cytosine methyltransferase [Yoonia sp.]|uniref:DNA cytosine methyltransferase n=1 Tax=Yoonia sp. TaxID=2212373 RepID=UPI002FD96675